MKKIVSILPVLFLGCIAAFAQDQKIISDCTISYSVINSNASQQNNLGSKIIYIKGKDIRVDLMSNTFSQTVFYNSNSGNATVLKNVGDAKYISQYNAADWEMANSMYSGISVSFTNDTKSILNYVCKQAILKLKNGNTYTVYYAPAIMPSVTENPFEFKDIPGLILEYESLVKENEKITYTANKIDYSPVPSLQFEIPKTGYRVLH
jgi:GLPGLI family protein